MTLFPLFSARRSRRRVVVLVLVLVQIQAGAPVLAQTASPAPALPATRPKFIDPASVPPAIRPQTEAEKAEVSRLIRLAKAAQAARDWARVEDLVRQSLIIANRTYGPAHPEVGRALDWLARSYAERGQYGEAEPLYRKALEISRKALGDEHPDTGTRYNNLAWNLKAQGHYGEAELLYRKALTITRKARGEDHLDTGTSYNNLAATLRAQGRYAEAEPLFRKALDITRVALGEEHPDTVTSYNNLASNLDAQGRHGEAEPLYRKALEISRRAQGEDHPVTGTLYNNLAANLDFQGRYGEAEPLFRKALEITRKAQGEDHPVTGTRYNNLASNLDDQGRYGEAEPLYRKALEITGRALGEVHPSTGKQYSNLASNLSAQGRYGEAESLYRKALEITLAALGEGHPDTGTSYSNLALNLNAQARYSEAEPLLLKALEVTRKALGENDPDMGTRYNNLAGNLSDQGRYVEAEPISRKALEIRRMTLGEAHPETGRGYSNLAANLNAQARYGEAEPLLRKSLEIIRKALGEEHPDTGTSYNNLAINLNDQGRYGEAEPLLRKALEITRNALGEEHPSTGTSYNNLAMNLNNQARYGEAEPLLRKALEIARKGLGEDHPSTATSYNNLAWNLSDQGHYGEAEPLAATAVEIARRVRDLASGVGASGEQGALQRARAGQGDGPQPLRFIYGNYVAIAYGAALSDAPRLAALRSSAFTAAQDYTASAAERAMAQAGARAAAGGGALGALVERQQRLAGRVRALDAQAIQALGRGDKAGAERLRIERERALADLTATDADLARDFPAYAQLVSPRAVEIAALQSRLAADEGLILIVPIGEDVFSFAVSKTSAAWNRLDKGAAGVEARVRALRGQMGAGERGAEGAGDQALTAGQVRFDRAAAFGLYQDLVAPVEGALGGVSRLYTVTSGSLGDLPLAMLMTRAPRPGSDDSDEALADPDAPWLIERYALSTLPSVSSLGVRGRDGDRDGLGSRPAGTVRSAGTVPFIGYGAPVLAGSGGSARGPDGKPATGTAIATFENGHPLADPQWLRANFGFLTGPLRELPRMAAELKAPRGSVHLEAAATERAIKADASLADARIVAFATHGFLPGQVPGISEPGLVFTPPATASLTDDGVLTASEAASLRFTADWIILSACDTASSDGQGAESLSSLSRAFLYAGAGALLASHWPVDDGATAALTTQTLALRQANPSLTRSQALQRAMRIVRTGRMPDGTRLPGWSPRWANPARWAAFTIITNQDR